jgi:molybdopterin-guanine dinucleotide biosynthesis protein A
MGSDKGLLSAGSGIWAGRAASKLSKLDIPVLLSVNATQLATYGRLFPTQQLVVDSVDAKGPLKGLLSVHMAYPQKDIQVLACDMVDMDIATLQLLKQTYETETEAFDYYAYENNEYIEPLCAVYPARTLQSLHAMMVSGALPFFSLNRLIAGSNYKSIPITDAQKFANYNSNNPFV